MAVALVKSEYLFLLFEKLTLKSRALGFEDFSSEPHLVLLQCDYAFCVRGYFLT